MSFRNPEQSSLKDLITNHESYETLKCSDQPITLRLGGLPQVGAKKDILTLGSLRVQIYTFRTFLTFAPTAQIRFHFLLSLL